jgi:hypothetical protein
MPKTPPAVADTDCRDAIGYARLPERDHQTHQASPSGPTQPDAVKRCF